MISPTAAGSPSAPSPAPRRLFPILFVGLLACLASLTLYALPVARPILIVDDFQIVFRSWTWHDAWKNLWDPSNEHTMPLGRISTALLATAAGWRPTVFPQLAGLQGPFALVVGMILAGLFVGREMQHPFFGLAAMALFGVSTVFHQAIYWFSASFSVLALDTFLLALLAAQHAVRTGRRFPLALCALACALAPGWFASGILAGPLCCIYLFAHCRNRAPAEPLWRYLATRAPLPLLGSLAFLALTLPVNWDKIMHLHHYGEKSALQAFDPAEGLISTCRSVVDNLALGMVGVAEIMCPKKWVAVPFSILFCFAFWWTWRAPQKPLVLVGIALIGGSYLLVYGARADWAYDDYMWHSNWTRYHLLPQLGLAFFIAGGMPRWTSLSPNGNLSARQVIALLALIGFLFVLQLPRGILTHVELKEGMEANPERFIYALPGGRVADWRDARIHAEQVEAMRRIEAVDALCRQHHIDAGVARRVLEPIRMTYDAAGDPQHESNWQFLRGSPDPQEISDEEARRILQPAASERWDK
jgi:hypothetical protein